MFLATYLSAEPVVVHFPEGAIQAYLVLRDPDGKLLASGLLTQLVRGDQTTARLVFRFKDGSIDDETASFSQKGHFQLLTDHHVQRGPTFPKPMDVSIDTSSGQVTVRSWEKNQEKVETSYLELPADLVNGILPTILKNTPPDAKDLKFSFLAATPKPRIVKLAVTAAGQDLFFTGGTRRQATHFNIKIDLGGVAGVVAPLVGKKPSDIDVWIAKGIAPAFLRLEGAMYIGGPVWRSELTNPVWPASLQEK